MLYLFFLLYHLNTCPFCPLRIFSYIASKLVIRNCSLSLFIFPSKINNILYFDYDVKIIKRSYFLLYNFCSFNLFTQNLNCLLYNFPNFQLSIFLYPFFFLIFATSYLICLFGRILFLIFFYAIFV